MSAHTGAAKPLRFGQVVIGPPGSGKTTYCRAMQQFLTAMGRRVVVVNMDPANEGTPYPCAVDISELVTLDDVMENLQLGPNGGLLYCIEYVEANLDWLESKMTSHGDCYFLFDCPGQVELYTHQSSVKNMFSQLTKWNFRVGMFSVTVQQMQTSWKHFMADHFCFPLSVPTADGSPPGGLSLLCRSSQVHLCPVHVSVHHVARGAPPRQHPFQDGSHRAVRKTR